MDLIIFSLTGFILGSILGSFIKASVDRFQKNVSIKGRSYCESCQKQLKWYDLFPILSYLILQGKCRFCHKRIPISNFLVELGVGFLIAFIFYSSKQPALNLFTSFSFASALYILELVFKVLIVSVFCLVALIDGKTGLIPDRITYPAVAAIVIVLITDTALKSWIFYQSILSNPLGKYLMLPYSSYFIDILKRTWFNLAWTGIGALAAALFFVLLIIITKGRGMGWGDVKYVLFLGLALGFPNILIGLLIAFLSGALVSIILMAFGKKKLNQTIAFGPFLSLGAGISFFWGSQILNWYLNYFRL